MSAQKFIKVKALRTIQGSDCQVFSFFIYAKDLNQIADITRLQISRSGELSGFQRTEIKSHIKGITDYLDLRDVIFPNALILALSSNIKFSQSRGSKAQESSDIAQSGILTLPIFPKGERIAWIVDGQQRALALENTKNKLIPIPVVGFISDSLDHQREQFILVNKVKPLPNQIINELLPSTRSIILPKEINSRKLPSELCYLMNTDSKSAFYQLIKRPYAESNNNAYINATSVINMIRNSINNPLGALATFKDQNGQISNIDGVYNIILNFWNAVYATFPNAWKLDPRHSRLTHSVGILAMGLLMDQIYSRHFKSADIYKMFCQELGKIARFCAWTEGEWPGLNLPWNEFQNTPKDIKRLQEFLIHTYNQSSHQ